MFPADLARRRLTALVAAALLVGLLPATALAASPSASPQSVSTFENIALPIVLTGTDPDGDPLTFAIVTGPSTGLLSGITNETCDSNTPSSCTADVTYTPTADSTGPDSFTYSVDDGSSSDAATITISVDAVNHAPTGTDKTVATLEDTAYTFGTADFGFSDPTDSPPNSPARGQDHHRAGGRRPEGQRRRRSRPATRSRWPTSPATSSSTRRDPTRMAPPYATFTFQVRDNGGTANGGVDLDQSPNTITIDVTPVNDAPTGTDKTVTTLEDTPYVFGTADFGFGDPSDSPANTLLAVKITTVPAAGVLKDNGVDGHGRRRHRAGRHHRQQARLHARRRRHRRRLRDLHVPGPGQRRHGQRRGRPRPEPEHHHHLRRRGQSRADRHGQDGHDPRGHAVHLRRRPTSASATRPTAHRTPCSPSRSAPCRRRAS